MAVGAVRLVLRNLVIRGRWSREYFKTIMKPIKSQLEFIIMTGQPL